MDDARYYCRRCTLLTIADRGKSPSPFSRALARHLVSHRASKKGSPSRLIPASERARRRIRANDRIDIWNQGPQALYFRRFDQISKFRIARGRDSSHRQLSIARWNVRIELRAPIKLTQMKSA